MKVYFITHARTEQQVGVAADRWQLSARGVDEARSLATHDFWHTVDRVVITSERKTWLTVADLVQERSLPVWIDSRLDELRRAGWTENYVRHVAAVFAHPATAVGGWEPVDAVKRRALAALDGLQQRFASETVAIVGHGLCLSVLRAAILGADQVDFDAWQRLPFASYAEVSLSPVALLQDFALAERPSR